MNLFQEYRPYLDHIYSQTRDLSWILSIDEWNLAGQLGHDPVGSAIITHHEMIIQDILKSGWYRYDVRS